MTAGLKKIDPLAPVRMQATLRSTKDLITAGLVSHGQVMEIEQVAKIYDVAITPHMAQLIDRNEKADPIALQFVPSARELKTLPDESRDPIGDYAHSPLKAIVHRHADRVLLKPTNICAVYCRFCFRRDMVGKQGDSITQNDVDEALAYIAAHDEICEVILTGGDPLMLGPKKLGILMRKLQAIPHIRWIRIHTRVPVSAPDKMTPELFGALRVTKPVLMAIHINHAREVTPEAGAVFDRLTLSGIVLLGQSVLLRGVNDNVEALSQLFTTMMKYRIKPYYLHHLDMTVGTSHFRVSLARGMGLMKQLRRYVSGVCLPSYVLDIPGGVAKIPVSADYIRPHPDIPQAYILTDPQGHEHIYHEVLG